MAPALAWQRPSGDGRGVEGFLRRLVAGDEILDAATEPARAAASALVPQDPATHLGGLETGEVQREGAVRRVEHMVPLVEDVARRQPGVAEPAECGLDHDEGMIGDDEARMPSLSGVALDEAESVV